MEGLDFINENRRHIRESVRNMAQERAEIYARCFGTADGQWVLADLVARLERPVAKAGKDISFAHQREGENNLIREIRKTCAVGAKRE